MDIRSLGYRTDVMLRVLEGGECVDHGDYLVVRSPENPQFWWGQLPAACGAAAAGPRSQLADCYPDDEAGPGSLVERRIATQRRLAADGHGGWVGAFTGGQLVAQLGRDHPGDRRGVGAPGRAHLSLGRFRGQ